MFSLTKQALTKNFAAGIVRQFSKERALKGVKLGNVVVFNDSPHKITKTTKGKRGKGGGFVRAIMKNLLTGAKFEHTYTSDEVVEIADMESLICNYSWNDGQEYHFTNPENYDDVVLPKDDIDNEPYMSEGMEVRLRMYKKQVIGVELPITAEYQVVDFDHSKQIPSSYWAQLESGAWLTVPDYVKKGDRVKVNIDEERFVERA